MRLAFQDELFANLDLALTKEWLETNRKGAYSSSTVLACHTRKYHSLLAVPIHKLDQKCSLLSKVDLAIKIGDHQVDLSTNKFPTTFYPKGHEYIKSFEYDTCPRIVFRVDETGEVIEFAESIMLMEDEETLLIRYDLITAPRSIEVVLTPFLAYRNIHTLTKENDLLSSFISPHEETNGIALNCFSMTPYPEMPELFFGTDLNSTFVHHSNWHYNFEYLEEVKRGFDAHEDLFTAGFFKKQLSQGESFFFFASTGKPTKNLLTLWDKEARARMKSARLSDLQYSAKNFFVERDNGDLSIIAGYPWFNEWGRDAMIALPGLAFCTGRFEEGLNVLKTFAHYESDGLLPNYLPLRSDLRPSYNSIDSSLWFFWALKQYYIFTSDKTAIEVHFKKTMTNILKAIIEGRHPWAKLHENALLWAGSWETQLTWMDAQVDGVPVTPRYGYAVEICSLWYMALNFYLELGFADDAEWCSRLTQIVKTCKESFLKVFWNEQMNMLADVVNEHGQDLSLRPNQIFAVSVGGDLLSEKQEKLVVRAMKVLLTPFGLRTLSPRDSRYKKYYEGSPKERDGSYHQGTVWAWPVGAFVDAFLKISKNKVLAAKVLSKYFGPLYTTHLKDHGILNVSEIFDGDPPHRPNGCIAQAWSVGELLRASELIERCLNNNERKKHNG